MVKDPMGKEGERKQSTCTCAHAAAHLRAQGTKVNNLSSSSPLCLDTGAAGAPVAAAWPSSKVGSRADPPGAFLPSTSHQAHPCSVT